MVASEFRRRNGKHRGYSVDTRSCKSLYFGTDHSFFTVNEQARTSCTPFIVNGFPEFLHPPETPLAVAIL